MTSGRAEFFAAIALFIFICLLISFIGGLVNSRSPTLSGSFLDGLKTCGCLGLIFLTVIGLPVLAVILFLLFKEFLIRFGA